MIRVSKVVAVEVGEGEKKRGQRERINYTTIPDLDASAVVASLAASSAVSALLLFLCLILKSKPSNKEASSMTNEHLLRNNGEV